MILNAIVHEAEEGGFWAEIPALHGCVSQGETLEELLENITDAATGWLEVANERANRQANASSTGSQDARRDDRVLAVAL